MSNLFEIEYQKKFPFVKVSKKNLFAIFFIALLTGIGAFIYETLLDYIAVGVLFDRGFLIGPFLPIYFFVIFFGLLYIKTPKRTVKNYFLSALCIGGGITLFEFIVGNLFEWLFKVQLWIYDGFMPLSYKYVSLTVFLVWGLLGALFLFYIIPLLKKLADKIPEKFHLPIFISFCVIFLTDLIATLVITAKNGWKYKELYYIKASMELSMFMVCLVLALVLIILVARFLYKSFYKFKKTGTILFLVSLIFPIFSCIDQLKKFTSPFSLFLARVGYVVAAFYIYFLLALPFIFLLRFIFAKSTKKEFWKMKLSRSVAVYVCAFCSIVVCGSGAYALKHPTVTHLTIGEKGNKEALKIVAVSDIHYGTTGNDINLKKMVERLNKLKPDVIFFLGDVIDNYMSQINTDYFIENMNLLEATYGVYAIPGNHEYNYNGHQDLSNLYLKTKIQYLVDEAVVVADRFLLVGREDATWLNRESLSSLIPYDNTYPIIVLDHQPQSYKESEEERVSLQLSGHTHNGQLFPANWVVNLFYRFVYHSPYTNGKMVKDDFTLYITRGYGAWGFPMRTTGSSEIVSIDFYL